MRKSVFEVSKKNRTVQPEMMARGLKCQISLVVLAICIKSNKDNARPLSAPHGSDHMRF